MCTFTKFICKSFSVTLLALLNVIFFLLGLSLVAASVYTQNSKWSRFFYSDFLFIMIVAGVSVVVVSGLGLAGACSQKKRYLCPYLVLLLACFGLQVAGAVLVCRFDVGLSSAQNVQFNEENYSQLTSGVMNWLKDNTEEVFQQAQCSITDVDTGAIACEASDSSWFQDFVNTKCQSAAHSSCLTGQGANVTFCMCKEVLTSEVKRLSLPLSIAAASLAALELLLIVCVLGLCVCRLREKHRRQNLPSLQTSLYQPEAQYIQHVSVGPEVRRAQLPNSANAKALSADSQAISLV